MRERPVLLAIDGNNLAMRSIKAAEGRGLALSTDDGEVNTGPLLLFINLVAKYVRHVEPDSVVVCFDRGRSLRRLAIYPEYKGNRSNHASVVTDYFTLMKEWLSVAGLYIHQRESYEADDLIGAYWRAANAMDMVIVSGDKDLLQLVSGPAGVVQIRPQQALTVVEETWDEARVLAEIGCTPEHLPILKALMGDTSDNILGLRGVGPKRAAKIAADNNWVLERIMEDDRCREHRDLIRRNYDLVNLRDIFLPGLVAPPPFRPTEPESIAWSSLVDFYDRYQLESVKIKSFTLFGERHHGAVQGVPI